MSTTITVKCDRCGVTVADSEGVTRVSGREVGIDSRNFNADLCPKCLEEWKWFKAELEDVVYKRITSFISEGAKWMH